VHAVAVPELHQLIHTDVASWRLSVLLPEAKPDGPGSRTCARRMPAMKAVRDPPNASWSRWQ
jgi:hypothetical protein